MSRISERFDRGGGVFIAYLTAGYPSMEATVDIAVELAGAGVDILELGVPFSDPVADGPVIQRASEAALRTGTTLDDCLDGAQKLAARVDLPVVLFSYYNPLLQYGLDRLAGRMSDARIDGLLVTDVVPEESSPVLGAMRPRDIDTVFLAAPTSSDERLKLIASVSTGFVYAVSRTGVTGTQDTLSESVSPLVDRVRRATELPVAVGFGVSSKVHVDAVLSVADGVVVGSRFVSEITDNLDDPQLPSRLARLSSSLRHGDQ